ncbi:O-antigen ligase family protein [Caulobacter sp. 17J80-11]|nr:O-antigen ligase family protein [Caulobacter sp. 17J80-11]
MAFVLLALSVVLGGASRENALPLALVELAATPLLVIAGRRLIASGAWREHKFPLALLAGLVAVPLLQLLPLPFGLWRQLPGRAPVAAVADLAGAAPAWATFSLTPEATWRAVLALIPPAAMFLAALTVSSDARRRMAVGYLLAAILSLLLGALQLLGGVDGPFYPYASTNYGSAVGLFANRNHLAALLVASLPLAGVFVGEALSSRRRDRSLRMVLAGLFYLLVLVGIASVRSRAGILLAGPALVASLLIVWRTTGARRTTPAVLGVAGVSAAALAAVALFALNPILARFDEQGPEGRFETWPTITQAADAHLPLGAGVGAFDVVYRTVEPLESVGETFLNHAHNDFLETWLETGWLGAAVLAGFVAWWAKRSWRAWTADGGDLARAASAAIALLLLHSAADYPLRTETLAVFLAFCCAVLERGGARQRRTPA